VRRCPGLVCCGFVPECAVRARCESGRGSVRFSRLWVRPGTHAFYFIFNNRCQPPRACRHGCPAVEHGLLHLSWPGGKCFPRQLEKDRSNIVWRPIARCGHGQAVPQHAAPHPSCSPSSRRNHAECLACSDTSYVCHGFCVHCTIAPPWKKTVCLAAMIPMTHSIE
jgi:hypothetical protein